MTPLEIDVVLAYAQTFETPSGQAVLEDLKKHVDANGYVPNSDRTIYNAGKRDLYNMLLHMIAQAKTFERGKDARPDTATR